MRFSAKSRLSFVVFVGLYFFLSPLQSQQKANDFTKRASLFDGKIYSPSGRTSNFNRLNRSATKRISLSEWPSHYSPFGGRRYPMGSAKVRGNERVATTKIEIDTPIQLNRARENSARLDSGNINNLAPAASSVEFRDAYYSQLNDRVDEWMEKVNNMSLRDINRYQFRRGRSNEPGFPVQRAGGATNKDAASQIPLKNSGLSKSNKSSVFNSAGNYWMGPKKNTSNFTSPNSLDSAVKVPPNDMRRENFKSSPKPLFGPKTIRVEVNKRD